MKHDLEQLYGRWRAHGDLPALNLVEGFKGQDCILLLGGGSPLLDPAGIETVD